MSKKVDKSLLVGVDIGTSKIAAIVGEITPEGEINIIGFGSHPSHGLKRGVVVNIESTVAGIQHAVEEAELMAGCQIHSAYTGIVGSHIRGLNSHGIVAIRDREVTQFDVERVIDAAKAVAIPADQQILHVLPQEFLIDNQDSIRDPIGMSGVRLEAKVHMVTGAVSAAENIAKCVKRCGLDVVDIILEQLASSYAVLSEDEKELGVFLVDIGGGTSDIAIFTDGAIRYTSVIPIAGDQVNNDIAVALRTPAQQAEQIKIKHGCALREMVESHEMIEVTGVGERATRNFSRKLLAEVIEARYEELFQLIKGELRRSGFDNILPVGVVLTGGASKMPYLVELAERVLGVPVRLGSPQGVKGLQEVINNPSYSTGVGLLMYGRQQQSSGRSERFTGEGMKGVWGRMKNWFQVNF